MKLSKETQEIANQLIDDYQIVDSGGLRILQIAMEAFDMMRKAQKILEKDSMVLTDKYGRSKAHPMVQTVKETRGQVLQAMKLLNLDFTYAPK
jgi:phage terminase small subunit